jgi:uncharacterized protein
MKRDEAISRLKEHEVELKRLGVAHRYLFGSTAHDEAGMIPTSICFSTVRKALSDSMS